MDRSRARRSTSSAPEMSFADSASRERVTTRPMSWPFPFKWRIRSAVVVLLPKTVTLNFIRGEVRLEVVALCLQGADELAAVQRDELPEIIQRRGAGVRPFV